MISRGPDAENRRGPGGWERRWLKRGGLREMGPGSDDSRRLFFYLI